MSTDAIPLSEATEEELRAFVGPRSDYYVGSWLRYRDGEVRRPRFRVSAFWLVLFSLAYRKQYRAVWIIGGLLVAEGVLEQFVVLPYLGVPSVPPELNILITLLLASVAGWFANSWYLQDALRAISRVRGSGRAPEEQLRELASRGGRSIVAAVVVPLAVILVFVVVMVAVSLALGIPLE